MFQEYPVLSDLIVIAAAFVISLLLYFIVFRLILTENRVEKQGMVAKGIRQLRIPLLMAILIIFLKIAIPLIHVDDSTAKLLQQLLSVMIIVTLALTLIKVMRIVTDTILMQYDVNIENNLEARKVHTNLRVIRRILTFIIILIALGAALMTFERVREVGLSLLASAGIVGIILGFAAQKLIATLLAGLQIAITQPIRIDDVLIVEGEWGRVEEIRLTYVVILIWDKRRLIVPTTYFIENSFQNWTRVSADLLGTVYIYTDYRVNFEDLRKALTEILQSSDRWDGKVNNIQVTNATEKTVEVRALMSAADSSKAWDLRVYVREKLIEFLQQHYPESLPQTRVILQQEG